MNIKTRKILRALSRKHPEMRHDAEALFNLYFNKERNEHSQAPVEHPQHKPVDAPKVVKMEQKVEPIVEETVSPIVESESPLDILSLSWNELVELAKLNDVTSYKKKKSDLISELLELQEDGTLQR